MIANSSISITGACKQPITAEADRYLLHSSLRAALPNRQPSERRSDFLCRCDCANPRIIPHQANLHQSYLVPAHPRRILFLTAPGLPPVQAQRDSLIGRWPRQGDDSFPAGLLRTPADTLNETSISDDSGQLENWGVIRQITCAVLRGWAPTT